MTFGSIRNNRKEHLGEGKGQRALLRKDNSSEATQHTGAADKSTIYACGCIDLSELLMTTGNSHASTLSGARESMHGAHRAEFRQHSTCYSQAALWTRVGNQKRQDDLSHHLPKERHCYGTRSSPRLHSGRGGIEQSNDPMERNEAHHGKVET